MFKVLNALLVTLVMIWQSMTVQAQQTSHADDSFTVKVNVHEVLLHATVRNNNGTPVAGLGQNDFKVFEDHVLQPIKHFSHEDIPVTVGIVIDNSGSMRPKRAEVIAAALAFAGSSNPHDQMFLVNFNEHVSFGLPAGMLFTDQPEQLKTAMDTFIADGQTALFDAVAIALEHLKKGDRDKKVLIIISDGSDNASVHTKAQVLALASKSDAIIYGLGIYEPDDPDVRDPHVLSQFSKATGGESYYPATLREVLPICERIAHEVRNQYTISYVPSNQQMDGTFRAIQVKASHGLTVVTRAGYVAPLRSPTVGAVKPEMRN